MLNWADGGTALSCSHDRGLSPWQGALERGSSPKWSWIEAKGLGLVPPCQPVSGWELPPWRGCNSGQGSSLGRGQVQERASAVSCPQPTLLESKGMNALVLKENLDSTPQCPLQQVKLSTLEWDPSLPDILLLPLRPGPDWNPEMPSPLVRGRFALLPEDSSGWLWHHSAFSSLTSAPEDSQPLLLPPYLYSYLWPFYFLERIEQ